MCDMWFSARYFKVMITIIISELAFYKKRIFTRFLLKSGFVAFHCPPFGPVGSYVRRIGSILSLL